MEFHLNVRSSVHMVRIHYLDKLASDCRFKLSVHFESVDMEPLRTISVVNSSLLIDIENECSGELRGVKERVCILQLTTDDWYLNVTLQLQYDGQSDPRCHKLAVSVFDLGESLRMTDYPLASVYFQSSNNGYVKEEFPLTDHANPIFLRDEICSTRSLRYVSTTNSVLFIIFLDQTSVSWNDFNLSVVAYKTHCQAFSQFPLQYKFKKRIMERNSYWTKWRIQTDKDEFYRPFDYYASLRLELSEDDSVNYGFGLYLRNAQVTYTNLGTNDPYLVTIRKHSNRCFVYQYIHNIYYNTWLNKSNFYISVSTINNEITVGRLTRSLITFYLHISHMWVDNKTLGFRLPKEKPKTVPAFSLLNNNAINVEQWDKINIYKNHLLAEITCFPQEQNCRNISNNYISVPYQLDWHIFLPNKLKMLYHCYRFGTLIFPLCLSVSSEVKWMNIHSVNCLTSLIAPLDTIKYWFTLPYNNKAIHLSYVNDCKPTTYVDHIAVTRIVPHAFTIKWKMLPTLSIAYFGNPVSHSFTIIDIQRTRKPLISKQACAIIINVSAVPINNRYYKTKQQKFTSLDHSTYVIMNTTKPLTWNSANLICQQNAFTMFKPHSDLLEKHIVASVLEKTPTNIPVAIFSGAILGEVTFIL